MTIKQNSKTAVKWILIAVSGLYLFIMLIMPLTVVITQALSGGLDRYVRAVTDEYTIKAAILTLFATVVAVTVNTFFGLFAAFTITKFKFRGKKFITTLIDIPFAVSPIIAGLIFILVFGRIGWAYDFINFLGIKIVFAIPGIIIATVFVTFPFIAREIIPVLNAQGNHEEEAAALMGASGIKIFRKITLPHIKWALLYGIILCTARAMGEFGAVSVLSGHLRGKTNTLPLHVEILYNEFKGTEAFAVSSILVIFSIVILIIKTIVEYKGRRE